MSLEIIFFASRIYCLRIVEMPPNVVRISQKSVEILAYPELILEFEYFLNNKIKNTAVASI